MAGSGRFGKYGDLKRKQQIRATRKARAGQDKVRAREEALRKISPRADRKMRGQRGED